MALVQEGELGSLVVVAHLLRALEIIDRRSLGMKMRPLVRAWQERGAPVRGVTLGKSPALRVAHHNEARQILGLAPQPVGRPRAQARKAHPRHPRVHHEQGRRMIVRLGEHRMNERHLVDVPAEVRENLGDHLAGLAPGREPERRLHQRPDLVLEESGRVLEVGSNSRIDRPCQRSSAGLYSQVSTWLGPPLVKTQITRLARAGKCGGRIAIGLT